ncbi:MAG TPA: hypothetical protein VIW45_19810 [Vicinamibacterales bacterium]|jgi:hypothetical protein
MRSVLVALALAFVTISAAPARAEVKLHAVAAPTTIAATTYALQQPAKDINVDINVNHGGGRWYRNPVWIAIGVLAAIVLLVLIVLAARGSGTGGGTTIIRD